jgi:glycosyltransferase involved in cell wall biosynthesis
MLWLRKAYTLLFRKSKTAFLRFLAATPFTGGGPLKTYEPEFPALDAYLPRDFRNPFTATPLSAEILDQARLRRRAGAVPLATRYDIVLLPAFQFDFRFHRPRQLAAHFARAGHRVFGICPSVRLEPDSAAPYKLLEREKNLWEVNIRGRRFDFHAQLADPETAAIMLGSLEKLYAECGIAENCVIVQCPAWHPVAGTLRDRFGAKILYDCVEAGQPNMQEERRLTESSDVFTVAAPALQARFASLGKTSIVVGNAADFDFFQQGVQMDVLPGVPWPVVGYIGAITGWTDLDLVLEAARRRPHYTFVLLGRNLDQDLAKLAALENVRILGPRPYR